MRWYWLASFSPVLTLALACGFGGVFAWVALLHMTAHVLIMDRLPGPSLDSAKGGAWGLTAGLALAHLLLLPAVVRALVQPGLPLAQMLALGLAAGLFFGQVSNSNAHELIHRPARWERSLGVAVFVSLLFGHHASAHRLVHHVHVATDRDPNSARPGEGFWRFLPRAWLGSFRAGFRAEAARWRGLRNPYAVYVGGALAWLALIHTLAGAEGVAVYLGLAAYAQMQLLLADYVQHYGLRRRIGPDGRPEPVAACHSWNAPQWYSGAMMLNAPRHSDHHQNPMRGFADLRLDRDHPVLPRSMPVMAALAMVPPLWRRVMDPRLRQGLARIDAGR